MNMPNIKRAIAVGFLFLSIQLFLVMIYPDGSQNPEISEKSKLPSNYWESKIMNHISIKQISEVKFNATDFLERFASKLGIPKTPVSYISMSGSLVTIPKNQATKAGYIHISRILQLPCQNPYREDGTYEGYCFQTPVRSFVYAQFLNTKFESIKETHKGIQYPLVYDIFNPDVDLYPGPEDARMILDPWQNVILSFNMADRDQNKRRRIWTFNVTSGSLRLLRTDLGTHQKNWIPFFINSTLYHLYSWMPFKILDCTVIFKKCSFIEPNLDKPAIDGQGVGTLRGGSALFSYGSYYVATARTHRDCGYGRVYRPHFVVISSRFEIIYVSEYLEFDSRLFIAPIWDVFPTIESIPPGGYHTKILTTSALTPSHDGSDWLAEFSVNDQKNVLITLVGFGRFLDSVISAYESSSKTDSSNATHIPNLIEVAQKRSEEYCSLFK